MQLWMIAISPAAKLPDLESVADLSRLAACSAELNDEPLDQQSAPHVSAPV